MAMQGHQINLNAQTLYERGQLLPEDCWNEWIYGEFRQQIEHSQQ